MSESIENVNDKLEKQSDIMESIVSIVENVNVEEKKEYIEEKKDEIVLSFGQLFECYLMQKQSDLDKFNLKLTPEMQKYFLLLCKEKPELFGTFEENLKKIILDNKINTNDIPEILLLVSKVYNIINSNKFIPTADPYEIIKSLLHLVFVVYIESNKIENSALLLSLLKIIDLSIDLIKMPPIDTKNVGCLNGLFKCK